jgi:hypothetical protein
MVDLILNSAISSKVKVEKLICLDFPHQILLEEESSSSLINSAIEFNSIKIFQYLLNERKEPLDKDYFKELCAVVKIKIYLFISFYPAYSKLLSFYV